MALQISKKWGKNVGVRNKGKLRKQGGKNEKKQFLGLGVQNFEILEVTPPRFWTGVNLRR